MRWQRRLMQQTGESGDTGGASVASGTGVGGTVVDAGAGGDASPQGTSAGTEGSPAPATSQGSWYETLPDDQKSAQMVRDSENLQAFVKQALDAHSYAGSSIRIPSKEASSEDMAAFREKLQKNVRGLVQYDPDDEESMNDLYKTLGRPEAPDQYGMPTFEPQDDVQVDTSPAEAFRGVAHKYGLSQKQFDGVVREMTVAQVEKAREANENLKAGLNELKKEWGFAMDRKVEQAGQFAEQFFKNTPELAQAIRSHQANAGVLKDLAALADALGTESQNLTHGDGDPHHGTITPREAQTRLTEIRNNRDHPYWRQEHPDHGYAVNEYRRLTRLALGEAGDEHVTTVGTGGGTLYAGDA